ncbi:unnamed protein product [Clonostachys rosea f. rosea IK726]|uniref:Uncharacterized protein n=1 Tax=Clonostachys rosea f. rosea IK726 TaxID=1349383 RepID=A0ACA9T964_BIOOC|nr:unnamed protein product [Clonostachys rosea f. rosea IK726]
MCLISLFSFRLNSIPGFNRGLSQPLFNNLYFLLFIVANVRERLREYAHLSPRRLHPVCAKSYECLIEAIEREEPRNIAIEEGISVELVGIEPRDHRDIYII